MLKLTGDYSFPRCFAVLPVIYIVSVKPSLLFLRFKRFSLTMLLPSLLYKL
jgi:hypothetical protein